MSYCFLVPSCPFFPLLPIIPFCGAMWKFLIVILNILFFNFRNLLFFNSLVVMGLCCCTGAFSSCGKLGLLFTLGYMGFSFLGFSCCRAQALGAWVSVVAGCRRSRCSPQVLELALSSSKAGGIFPVQGCNPGPLHWQAGSHPLCHLGSPEYPFCCNKN